LIIIDDIDAAIDGAYADISCARRLRAAMLPCYAVDISPRVADACSFDVAYMRLLPPRCRRLSPRYCYCRHISHYCRRLSSPLLRFHRVAFLIYDIEVEARLRDIRLRYAGFRLISGR